MEPEHVNIPGPAIEWMRSPIAPDYVFVKAFNSCTECAFGVGQPDKTLCSRHPCDRGVWVNETEAAVLRLEAS
jgi:hypothetical protein